MTSYAGGTAPPVGPRARYLEHPDHRRTRPSTRRPRHRQAPLQLIFQIDLDDVLRVRGITSLSFTGCTTNTCVESTLRDAFYRDYQCLLLTDCCTDALGGDQQRNNHDATLTVIKALFGWTTESDHLIASLTSQLDPSHEGTLTDLFGAHNIGQNDA
jgi:Isochorismatase family